MQIAGLGLHLLPAKTTPSESYASSATTGLLEDGFRTMSSQPSGSLPFAMVSKPPENARSPIVSIENRVSQ